MSKIQRMLLSLYLVIPVLSMNWGTAAAQGPAVKVVVFWETGCPACEKVLDEFLPSVQAQYGDDFSAELIEVVDLEDIDYLYQVGSAYGLAKDQIGVPFLIIDDIVLVGSVEITNRLPELVEQYRAAGGISTQVRDVIQAFDTPDPAWSGMSLGWILMIFMIAVLIFTLWIVFRAFQGYDPPGWPGWINTSIPVLAVIGLGVAVYLTYVEATYTPVVCGPVGDCNAVQNSSYSRIFGVIPVGLFGALGYLGVLVAWLYPHLRQDRLAEYAPVAILGMAGFGVLFSIYLTYLEIFVIFAVCIWCLSSALLISLILLASLPQAADWLGLEGEVES